MVKGNVSVGLQLHMREDQALNRKYKDDMLYIPPGFSLADSYCVIRYSTAKLLAIQRLKG